MRMGQTDLNSNHLVLFCTAVFSLLAITVMLQGSIFDM